VSDLTFWQPTMSAIDAIIDYLPRETRERIVQRLQLLAVAQEDRGDVTASYYLRALSGERCPKPEPKTQVSSTACREVMVSPWERMLQHKLAVDVSHVPWRSDRLRAISDVKTRAAGRSFMMFETRILAS
jgi:hypothetical protein